MTRTPLGLPAPVGFARSSWSKDPYSLGSHSYMKVGATPEHRDSLRQPILDRVFFAGEATSSDAPGTVLGALHSGSRAASDLSIVAKRGERIAVIGAGIAGAEAARALAQDDFEVIVVEARKRVGGRIQTAAPKAEDTNGWPVPVELGAWRVGSSDDELLSKLSELAIATESIKSRTFVSPTAQAKSYPAGATALKASVDWATQQPQDVSVADALDQSGAAKTAEGAAPKGFDGQAMLEQYLESLATTSGATAAQLSSWYGAEQAASDQAASSQVVTGGYELLVKDALKDVKTYLSTVVAEISYTESGVSLRLGTGESLRVDRVVVTVPLGVLKKSSIKFSPLLPLTHRTAIAALGVGTVDAVWLRFDKKFWTSDAAVWNLVGTDDDITTWINLEPATSEPVLVGLVGGDAALRVAKLSDDQLKASAMLALRPFAGD
ncbi:flavin monoamine oxidase family protein [Parafrigoribacterium soli]|uniref:flavin monoamine oxidase family protein n=1 Tax=Parafrigoribacterium soli TaxID=3144663 RepID=UPI0032F03DB2